MELICIYIYIYIYIYMYVYTHTHTHIHCTYIDLSKIYVNSINYMWLNYINCKIYNFIVMILLIISQ